MLSRNYEHRKKIEVNIFKNMVMIIQKCVFWGDGGDPPFNPLGGSSYFKGSANIEVSLAEMMNISKN